MQQSESLVTPFFKTVAVPDPVATAREGRPIFRNEELVEIRIAGDRHYKPVVPVNSMWQRVDDVELTFADRWPEAYAAFKAGQVQVAEGTPLSELPFLTEAKRAELRALNVYTAEALASLDGKNLKALGEGGRTLKTQAETYLSKAAGTADSVAMASEIETLKAQIAGLLAQREAPQDADDEREALKAQIAERTGSRPRGNPSVETLRGMLADLDEA